MARCMGTILCQICDSVIQYESVSDTEDMSLALLDHLADEHGWKLDDIEVERSDN